MIEFAVTVQSIAGASTKRVTVTLANHVVTFDMEPGELGDDPPSRADMFQAVKTLLRAAYYANTGTPAQRIAAMQAGISRLAYKYYQTGEVINP